MRALCEQLAATIDWSHYGALSGTHVCLRDVLALAAAYLANLRIWAVAPPPPELPPAQPPKPRTMTEVVTDFFRTPGAAPDATDEDNSA
jgi:hypothetical protein